MLTHHRHIEELRQYVAARQALPAPLLEDIEGHIAECGFCADIVTVITEFTEARQRVNMDNVHTEAEILLRKIREGGKPKKRAIRLTNRIRPLAPKPNKPDRMVLSAASVQEETPAYSTVATLHSSDDRVLLRILLEHATHEYAMYVLTEKQESAAFALIESPLTDHPVLTDMHGICRIPVTRELLLESDSFCIHPVLTTFLVTDEIVTQLRDTGRCEFRIEKESVEVTFEADTLSVRTVTGAEIPVHRAAYVSNDRKQVESWLASQVTFSTSLPSSGDRLLFY